MRSRLNSLKQLFLPASVFFAIFLVYLLSPVIASGDSVWTVFGAESLLTQGNLDLDEYMGVMQQKNFYWVEQVNGHYYSRFPIGPQLLAVPFVYVTDKAFRVMFWLAPGLENKLIGTASVPLEHITVTSIYWRVELLIASAQIALAALFIFLTARRELTRNQALLVTFVFAFCTSAWSVGSRSAGQHGASMLALALALYLLMIGTRNEKAVRYMALPLAFSYVIRPTNAIPILFLSLYVLMAHRKQFFAYFLWSLPISISFIAYNLAVYYAPFSNYYSAGRQLGSNPDVLEAAVGTIVSPARGLFIFSPILFCAVYGFFWKIRQRKVGTLDGCMLAIFVSHWAVLSSFGDWWGGHSYGPRYWSDLTPLMVYYMVPFVQAMYESAGFKRMTLLTAFIVLAAMSLFVHARGATSLATWAWNREPTNINDTPQRLWDWHDLMFLRGLRTEK
jgi:hypothetical protein